MEAVAERQSWRHSLCLPPLGTPWPLSALLFGSGLWAAPLFFFSDEGLVLVREPGEDFPPELSASTSHPCASLVLRCPLPTGKCATDGHCVRKGT